VIGVSVVALLLTLAVTTGLAPGSQGTASAMPFTGSISCTPSGTGVLYPPRYDISATSPPPAAKSHYLLSGTASGCTTITQGGWTITGGIIREVSGTPLARNCTLASPPQTLVIDIYWEATPGTGATSATYPAPSVATFTSGTFSTVSGAYVETWITGSVTGSFAGTTALLTANFDELATADATECTSPSGWYYSSWTGSGPNGASTMTV
jgi:hypothetical protein